MPIDDLSGAVQYAMDLVGIFAFALSGAFIAVRRDFDIFGTVILSEAAGLGGGLFRDLVLGVTPVAFTDLGYFFTPCAAAAIVYFGHRLYDDGKVHGSGLFDVSDAAALGLFSVTGTIKALAHGFNLPAAATLGSVSAVGGGVLASLLALEVPSLLRWDRDPYALPALVGAGGTAVLYAAGLLNVGTAVGTAVVAVSLRLLALRYSWRMPRSHFWRNPFAGMRLQPAQEPGTPAPAPLEAETIKMSPADMGFIKRASVNRSSVNRSSVNRSSVNGGSVNKGSPAPDPRFLLQAPRRDETPPSAPRERR
ncbi:trimeric intracellular cation channel family protein [Streptomyces sp. NPDC050619]|uniref:trimeric intracellular cation channel family protein n=1 Tax=Streptomyces sp. NPDC050619 TaxID=3157214 RepID=UPI003417FAC5